MPPSTPENNDPSKIWISREEYERLRAAENAQQQSTYTNPLYTMPPVVSVGYPDHSASDKLAKQQKIVALFLAVLLIISLSVSAPVWLAGGTMAVFLIYSLVGINDYSRLRRRETTVVSVKDMVADSAPSTIKKLLVIIGILLLLPVIGYTLFFMFIIFIFSIGGGPGS